MKKKKRNIDRVKNSKRIN